MGDAKEIAREVQIITETYDTAKRIYASFRNRQIEQLTNEIIMFSKPLANKAFKIDVRGTELEEVFDHGVVNIGYSITYEGVTPVSKKKFKHLASDYQICQLLLKLGPAVVRGVRKPIKNDMELVVSLLSKSVGMKYSDFMRIELPHVEFYTEPKYYLTKPDALTSYIEMNMYDTSVDLYYTVRGERGYQFCTLMEGVGSERQYNWEILMQMPEEIFNKLEKWQGSAKKIQNGLAENEKGIEEALEKIRNTKAMEARLLA